MLASVGGGVQSSLVTPDMHKSYHIFPLVIFVPIAAIAFFLGLIEYGFNHPLSIALGILELPVLAFMLIAFVGKRSR